MLSESIFTIFLAVVAITDLREGMIYDKVLSAAATVFLPLNFFESFVSFEESLLYSIIGFLTMFLLYKLKPGNMGGGDVKFVAVLGLWLGKGLFPAIFTASVLAAIFTIPLVIKNRNSEMKIPFGVFLSIGAFLQFVPDVNFFEVLP